MTTPQRPGRAPAYRIEIDGLVLRPWGLEDVAALQDLVARNQRHLQPWMPWAQAVPTLDDELAMVRGARARFDRDEDFVYGLWADGRAVGGAGLHPRVGPLALEIGYWVDADHQGRGWITAAAAALCRVGFDVHDTERIEIHCAPSNVRSAAVPQRLGFVEEGIRRKRSVGVDGRLRDDRVFTMLREEWPASPGAARAVRAYDGLGRPLL